MIRRFIIVRFLAMFIPAFLLFMVVVIYTIADQHIENTGNQIAARIGGQLGRMAGLIKGDSTEQHPKHTARLLSTLMHDPAITCVDVLKAGKQVRGLAQPRNLGCKVLVPEKTVEAAIFGSPDLKIAVGFNEAELQALRRETLHLTFYTGLAGLLAAVIFGIMAFRYSVGKPLSRLLTAIHKSKAGTITHAPIGSNDEIGNLCVDFNAMLDELEDEKSRTQETLDDLSKVYNSTPALLFTMNRFGIIRSASEFWMRETGYSADEVIDRPLEDLVCESARDRLKADILTDLQSKGSIREISLCIQCASGKPIDVLLSVVPDQRINCEEERFVCVMNDVTLLRRTEENLRLLAVTDQLTNLPNRRAINEYFASLEGTEQQNRAGWAVYFIDLDNFKTVNDTFGHEAGDEILRVGAQRICDIVGDKGLVARIGGDEFAVVLTDLPSANAAEAIAERLIDSLSRPVKLDAGTGHVGASIGIAYCKDQSLVPSEALRLSDQAMYLAKSGGKNRFALYDENQTATVRSRAELAQLVQSGLEEDWFEMYFQPIIDLETAKPVAFEALLRTKRDYEWLGSIEDLIRVAEETGQMETLGDWIFEESVAKFRTLTGTDGESEIAVTINLSPYQLNDRFIRRVKDCVGRHPDVAERLIFEITESVALDRNQAVCDLLQDLRGLGIQIAIDDFGSGYSSLSYISRLPVDILKLDKSFIDHKPAENGDPDAHPKVQATLVRTVVGLASDLGMYLVAEGLETSELSEQYHALGVQYGQGYVFGGPMPVSQTKSWLDAVCGNQSSTRDAIPKRYIA